MNTTPEQVYHEFRITRDLIYSKYSQGILTDEEFSKLMTALYNVCYDAIGTQIFDQLIDADREIHQVTEESL